MTEEEKLAEKRERRRATQRKYREANREKLAEKLRQWRSLNPERVRSQKQRQYNSNTEAACASTSKWRKENPEKVREQKRRHYHANKDKARVKMRSSALKRKYGITIDEFGDMLAIQGASCAICGATKPGGTGDFHVDHCHSSGAIRGLLCSNCNRGLGYFRDNPAALISAAGYLTAAESAGRDNA